MFVTGLKVNEGLKSDPEDEPELGACCGFKEVGSEEKMNGAFGITEGAVVVPVNDEKTSAGQQTFKYKKIRF